MKLSVVIPAYNEEKRIKKALFEITNYFNRKNTDYEIIVVDDGSTDSTVDVVKSYNNSKISVIQNGENKGKGYSIKRGMLAASGDYVFFTDTDMSTPITELDKLLKYMKDYQIVIGSRNLPESDVIVKQDRIRVMLGKAFPLIVNLLLMREIRDTQCGFKLFNKEIIPQVFSKQTIDGFAFDAEILFIAKKQGIKINEIPVTWKNDADSKLDIKYHVFTMLAEVIKIKLNEIRGVYEN